MTSLRPPFIATTALKDFWESNKPQVLLSEWCRLFGDSEPSGTSGLTVLTCPWENRNSIEEAYAIVDRTYEWMLPLLGQRLNAIHGTRYSDRYWRIVAGPWLIYFLLAVQDRYRRIKAAVEAYPEFSTMGLAGPSHLIPRDMLHFLDMAKGDRYNLQLITGILDGMGLPPSRKAWTGTPEILSSPLRNKNSLVRRLILVGLRSAVQPFASVFLRNAYFPSFKDELLLMAKTRGRAVVIYAPLADLSDIEPDRSMRSGLEGLAGSAEDDEFRMVGASLVPGALPLSLLEGWKRVGDFKRRHYSGKPKAVFSTNAYHFDEAFKRFAGEAADNGALICGGQHGGNYGSFSNMPIQQLEYKLADRFYSWGWKSDGSEGEIKPFPATKLRGRLRHEADNSREGVLFVTTSTSRFPFLFHYSEYHHLEYIRWQLRFLKIAFPRLGATLRARPHIEDGGWGYVERWRAEFPALNVETWAVPFMDSLRDCRIYVSDHLETTFVEALAAGKPSILFINPDHYSVRKEAKPYYDALKDSGILHHSPESGAAALEEAYRDVEAWWSLPARQEARRAFCGYFALTDENALDLWAAEFTSMAKFGRPAEH